MAEPEARQRSALVLHASADRAFVHGYLVPALGGEAGAQPLRALEVEGASPAELERAIRASDVAITVVSPALVADPWAQLAELLASSTAVARNQEVIPLLLEDCELPLYIAAVVGLDFRRRRDWERERDRLARHLASPIIVDPPIPCPYPGMRPFEARDAASFFGRDPEIREVLGLLDAGQRELFVLGPSGCGKSSMIAAGVLPRLAGTAVVRVIRPGEAPTLRLAEALGDPELDVETAITQLLPGPGAKLVVFVDQLEELFAQAPAEEHARFAAALRPLRADPRCILLLALRADFFAELLASELWRDSTRRHLDLLPLRGAALREAIERPARACEVYFEPGLTDRLLADAAVEPGVLPLLQETLVQLWSQRRRRLLTLAAYEAMGSGGRSGLAVAISSRAERCLDELAPTQRVIARRILLRMVSFGEGRPNTRRRQTRATLAAGEPPAALDAVLHELVAARLVTMDGDDRSGDDRAELCHEALVTAWPAFAEWVEARRADEQRRRQIQASADDWVARGRGASGLLDADELATAVTWRASDAARELGESPQVTELVEASRRALDHARRRRRRWTLGIFAGLAVFAIVSTTLAVIARAQTTAAVAERARVAQLLAEQYLETGRQLVVEGHPQRAIPYLVAARERGIDTPGIRQLFRAATRTHLVHALRHDAPVTSASYSEDGAKIMTSSDHRVYLWDAITGAQLGPPLEFSDEIAFASFLPRTGRALAVAYDKAWLWDMAVTPARPIPLDVGASYISVATATDDGSRLVLGAENLVQVWDTRTGEKLSPPMIMEGSVHSVGITRDGARIVTTSSWGNAVLLWDVATGRELARFEQNDGAANAAFSHDDSFILSTSRQRAYLWDVATGQQRFDSIEHADRIIHARLDPTSTSFVTATEAGSIQLWSTWRGNAILYAPMLHPEGVIWLELSPDGKRLLTAGRDKAIRVWDLARGRMIGAPIELEASADTAGFNHDGTRVITAGRDGVARVWEVPADARRLPLRTPHDAAFSPDGAAIAAVAYERLRIWTAEGELRSTWPMTSTRWLAFAPGRRLLATINGMDRVQLRDSASGEPLAGAPPEVGRTSGRAADSLSFAFSPDGRRFASTLAAREHTARVWDVDTGRPISPPLIHDARILSCRFSPDGSRVVTASEDHTARVWDATTGAELHPALQHPGKAVVSAAIFSPTGAHLATVTYNVVTLWDARTYRMLGTLAGHTDQIRSIAFTRDGARLATASHDHTARIWDVASRRPLTAPLEHVDNLESVSFSADGAQVVTTSSYYVRVWDAATGKPMTAALFKDANIPAQLSSDGETLLFADSDGLLLWDLGRDTRTLDEWRAIAATGAFPELARSLSPAR